MTGGFLPLFFAGMLGPKSEFDPQKAAESLLNSFELATRLAHLYRLTELFPSCETQPVCLIFLLI